MSKILGVYELSRTIKQPLSLPTRLEN